jgi:hypothetical protein
MRRPRNTPVLFEIDRRQLAGRRLPLLGRDSPSRGDPVAQRREFAVCEVSQASIHAVDLSAAVKMHDISNRNWRPCRAGGPTNPPFLPFIGNSRGRCHIMGRVTFRLGSVQITRCFCSADLILPNEI